jgi:hypothetical protein
MAVAVGALVMSVGGNVTAAVLITSANIRDNTIRSVDIRQGAIRSGDVANATLTGADIANSSVTGADVADGSVGTHDVANNSLTGTDIAQKSIARADVAVNAIGTSEIQNGSILGVDLFDETVGARQLKHVTYPTMSVTVPGNTPQDGNYTTRSVSVDCPTGTQLLGGGAGWPGSVLSDQELVIVESQPDRGNGWVGQGGNDTGSDETFEVYAICLTL